MADFFSSPTVSAVDPRCLPVRKLRYYRATSTDRPRMFAELASYGATGRCLSQCDARSSAQAVPVRVAPDAMGQPCSWSADAGHRWCIATAYGASHWTHDDRGIWHAFVRDGSGRVVERHEGVGATTRCLGKVSHGTAATPGSNLVGRAAAEWDEAGKRTTLDVSLSGYVLRSGVELLTGDEDPDWRADDEVLDASAIACATVDATGYILSLTDPAGHVQTIARGMDANQARVALAIAGGPAWTMTTHARFDAQGRLVAQEPMIPPETRCQ